MDDAGQARLVIGDLPMLTDWPGVYSALRWMEWNRGSQAVHSLDDLSDCRVEGLMRPICMRCGYWFGNRMARLRIRA